jgi:hypothetical protein
MDNISKRLDDSVSFKSRLEGMGVDLNYLLQRIAEYFEADARWKDAIAEKKRAMTNSRVLKHRGDDDLSHITLIISRSMFVEDKVNRLAGVNFTDKLSKKKPHYLFLIRILYNLFRKGYYDDENDSIHPPKSYSPLKYITAIMSLFGIHPQAGFCKGCEFHTTKCSIEDILLCPRRESARHAVWNYLKRNNLT